MFREIFCPSLGAQDCFTACASNILRTEHIVSASAFQATSRQQLGCILLQAVKHSLALLRMGKKIAQYMLCWLEYQ